MDYQELADVYEQLDKTTKNLEKRDIIADFLKRTPKSELANVILFLNGEIFPSVSEEVLGIADKMVLKALSKITGKNENAITNVWKEKGDLGLVAEQVVKKKTQTTLSQEKLTISYVMEILRAIARFEGENSTQKKTGSLAKLLSSAKPKEARYITRTALGDLRIGVGFGIIRDAIVKAFNVEKEHVQHAYDFRSDLSELVLLAKESGNKGLKNVDLKVGKPLRLMLYQKAQGISNGFTRVGAPAAIEYKYDGMRVQCHFKKGEVTLFTRRLDDVTKQFPDLVGALKEHVSCKECILEGEAVAYNSKTKEYVPFQILGKRIKRKHRIDEIAKKIPVVLYVFDMLYLEGKNLLLEPFKKRRAALERIVRKKAWQVELAKQVITGNEDKAQRFYNEALEKHQEGVMMKKLDAQYQPGSRVGFGVKVKPILEPLDLVITGAIWGEGKRGKWLSSYVLSCKKGDVLAEIGKMATGLSEEQFEEVTKRLEPLITKTSGKRVEVQPKLVVEVGYEEIQKSPTYSSGFALRFPRLIRFRDDKEEPDDLERIKRIYQDQKSLSQKQA